ncbi:MAG: glycosyltransferase family 25 protein [Pseudomonadota bacterium]
MAEILGLIIHLHRAVARREHVNRLRTALPVPSEILPAVDAKLAAPAEMARYDPALGRHPRYPFPLSDTEIAVTLSHRQAWARIIAAGAAAGLVVEDDVVFDPALIGPALDLARDNLTDDLLIRLPDKERERPGQVIGEHSGLRLFAPRETGLGMQAQIVGRGAAARLLEITERFDRPVDTTIQMTWETGLQPLTLSPPVVRDISNEIGGSTLQKRGRGPLERLRAELLRARYRAQVARAARG